MSEQENMALVRRLFEEVLNRFDLDVAGEILSPDFAHRVHGFDDSRGLEVWKQLVRSIFEAFPDSHWVVEEILAQGDRVAVHWTYSASHTGGEWAGIPPTGSKLSTPYMSFFDIADGRIVEERSIGDFFDFWQQFGVIPPLDEMIEQYKSKQA
jgi:steroid delta-isomerase-like uncharacterized protein